VSATTIKRSAGERLGRIGSIFKEEKMKKWLVLSVSAALMLLLVALYEKDICTAIIGGSMFIGTSVLWTGAK
jgi:hypothetical protein